MSVSRVSEKLIAGAEAVQTEVRTRGLVLVGVLFDPESQGALTVIGGLEEPLGEEAREHCFEAIRFLRESYAFLARGGSRG